MNAVREIQSSRQLPFERAWETARSEHRVLYVNASRHAANAKLMPQHTYPGGVHPAERFDGLVKRHAADNKIPYEKAWSVCQRSHSEEFAQMVATCEREDSTTESSIPKL